MNSRAAFTTYRISSATPSASWVLLHGSSIVRRYSSINHFFKKKFQIQKLTFNTRFHYTKLTLEVRFIAGSTDDFFREVLPALHRTPQLGVLFYFKTSHY